MGKYSPRDYTRADVSPNYYGTVHVLAPNGKIKVLMKSDLLNSSIVMFDRDQRGETHYFIKPGKYPEYMMYEETCKQRDTGHEWKVWCSHNDQINNGARPQEFTKAWYSDEALNRQARGYHSSTVELPDPEPVKPEPKKKAPKKTKKVDVDKSTD